MSEGPWAESVGPWAEAKSVGSWIWLIARCWWPSWIQRALQLVQMAIGYRPKVMVTRADRHSGQCGIRGPLFVLLGGGGYLRRGRALCRSWYCRAGNRAARAGASTPAK